MKKAIFTLTLVLTSFFAGAQQSDISLEHIGMSVRNLDSSIAFYSTILQLDSMPNPWKGFRVKWYKLGEHIQLHLIEGLKEPVVLPIMSHMSVRVKSIEDFITELKKRSIPYYDGQGVVNKINVRSDGVKQLLIKDPDGYWVEANNAVQ